MTVVLKDHCHYDTAPDRSLHRAERCLQTHLFDHFPRHLTNNAQRHRLIKHFYTNDGMVDIETARSVSTLSKIAAEIKQNIHLVEQAGIPVIPPETKVLGELPENDIISRYRQMLSNDFIIDVKLGNHAVSQKAEIMLLDEMFHKMISIR